MRKIFCVLVFLLLTLPAIAGAQGIISFDSMEIIEAKAGPMIIIEGLTLDDKTILARVIEAVIVEGVAFGPLTILNGVAFGPMIINHGFGPMIVDEGFGPMIVDEGFGPMIVNEG